MSNGPINRKKNVTGKASGDSMKTHGPAKTNGPVGDKTGYQQRKTQQSVPRQTVGQRPGSTQRPAQNASRPQSFRPTGAAGTGAGSSGGQRGSGGGMGKILIIAVIVLLLGGGGLSGLFGGGNNDTTSTTNTANTANTITSTISQTLTGNNGGSSSGMDLSSLLGGGLSSLLGGGSGSGSSGGLSDILGGSWFSSQTGIGSTAASSGSSGVSSPVYSSANANANYTAVNRSVAAGSRAKYTTVKGNGKDTFTILVYMCGADLESKSAMATRDLQEMLAANIGSKINLVIYTGGAKKWNNNLISATNNQIWQVKDGGLACLNKNAGSAAMTNPDTLTSFIQYGAKNFKADRYALILWDHGSGSVTGYGYDERNPGAGSMSLAGLNSAFQRGGLKFDFIGFDTCLMASVENALMASNYADYLIASEETEPGIGWYYTDWLTALGQNTSMATLDIGRQICDDFVSKCASQCRGQSTTLSVIDLAELSHTIPSRFNSFADGVTTLINNEGYKTVSNARNGSREFAASSRIDQVDLTDLCLRLATTESNALASALRESVKYNRTNMSSAYGLSVYFPYQRVSNVDKAVNTYAAIGMDDSYSRAIRAFATVESSGQAVSVGSSTSPLSSLFGGSASGGSGSGDALTSLLSSFLGGGGMDFLSGRTLTEEQLGQYLTSNMLDASKLVFQKLGDSWVMDLAPEQWALVHSIDMNMFYDNGEGYVDLGLDNLYDLDSETGLLIADTEGTWIGLDGQPVPYYRESAFVMGDNQWRITGRVPCILSGTRTVEGQEEPIEFSAQADLLVVFDQDTESATGYVAGARFTYGDETEAVAKNMLSVEPGDTIVLLADLYDYQQNYVASYHFGNPITVGAQGLTVSDIELPDPNKAVVTYRFTDIYDQAYWTPAVGK